MFSFIYFIKIFGFLNIGLIVGDAGLEPATSRM